MLTPFETLMRRLTQAGFSFENEPTRLHHQYHGDSRDVFFVYHEPRYHHPLSTFVQWRYEGVKRGIEAIISRSSRTSLRSFARGSLWAYSDRHSSAYGAALCVTDSDPVDERRRGTLAVQLPN